MSGLFLKTAHVEGLRPIRKFEATFAQNNSLIGLNGAGKTTFLHLLATVAGNEAATNLLANEPIGYVRLAFEFDGESLTFEARDSLELSDLATFKAKIPAHQRINLGIHEGYSSEFGVSNYDVEFYNEHIRILAEKCKDIAGEYKGNRRIGGMHGDGRKQAFLLTLLSSQDGGILLMDSPERHLDYSMKRYMSHAVLDDRKQIIQTTHCPEWLRDTTKYIEI